MNNQLHAFASHLSDVTEIVVNVHIIALVIINMTVSPGRALSDAEGYTRLKRLYRFIELLAGLITPLAKR